MTDKTLDASGNLQPIPPKGTQADSGHESFLGELFHSAVYAGIQEPLNGLVQIADGVLGTNALPKVQFISAPTQEKFGTLGWGAEQVGNAAGMLLPFLLLRKGVSSTFFRDSAAEGSILSERAALGMSLKEAAVTGFAYGTFLQPSNYQSGNRLSFLSSRLLDGTASAATFSALTASGLGIGKLVGSEAIGRSALVPLLRSPITQGVLSGIPGGAVSSEISALRSGRPLPTASEVGQSMATYSILGGVFGTANKIMAPTRATETNSNENPLTAKFKDQYGQFRDATARGMDRLSDILFPTGSSMGLRPALASPGAFDPTYSSARPDFQAADRPTTASDLTNSAVKMTDAVSATRPGSGSGSSSGSGSGVGSDSGSASGLTGGAKAEAGAESTTRPSSSSDAPSSDILKAFDKMSRQAVFQNKDGQDYVYRYMQGTLAQLKAQKLVSSDWEILPTQVGSPADMIGADYLLLNTRTGDVHMLDGTSNSDKYEDPSSHNVSALREGGLVYYENRWFNEMGTLKTDNDEPANIVDGVARFQDRVRGQLLTLTKQSSPFKLGETPIPQISVTDPAQAKAQIDSHLDWVRNNVDDSYVQDYLNQVRKSSTHLDIQMHTVPSDYFVSRVNVESDRAVANWAVAKLLGKSIVDQGKSGASDVFFHAKSGQIALHTDDGSVVNSGPMSQILADSRTRMLNENNLEKMIKPKQIEQLQAKYPSWDPSRIMQELISTIANGSSEIRAGGSLGEGPRTITNQIVSRLSAQPSERLTTAPEPRTQEVPQQPQSQSKSANSDQAASATGSGTADTADATSAVAVPKNEQLLAARIAAAWRAENLPQVTADHPADPDDLLLLIDYMLDDPANAPVRPSLQAILDQYKNGDQIARTAINTALAASPN